ncbi:uncharacterized protein LOC113079608 [Carassius auratus]|uniref:Uncharacterized protein LOC113079608 n=1 Tax=Carassius auratus TaxID=7957 RepID=A0A6P6NF60_CARAU|nr:uncharacterized protein LOC113079608 [Carassius auratus]
MSYNDDCKSIDVINNSSVSGVDEVKSVSVTVGDSVTLYIQRDDEIEWRFGPTKILLAEVKENNDFKFYKDSAGGRFRDRLNLDRTGSLSIINTSTTDSGEYIVTRTKTSAVLYTFRLGVYAPVPVPVFMRHSPQYSTSSERSSKCLLLCSVFNVSHVTLSWYKGNSSLSSISVSDLSISLSLPLEVEYQDNNPYSCAVKNHISNYTKDLDITKICSGVFGDDALTPVSVIEGDSVTLNIDSTDIQINYVIEWRFGPEGILIAKTSKQNNMNMFHNNNTDGRFRGRLKLEQTGSLIITKSRITDTGLYKVTSNSTETPHNTFNLTVYAHLPIPVITIYCPQNSSSSVSKCVLFCFVFNLKSKNAKNISPVGDEE